MGKKKVGQKPDDLSAQTIEYVSKCSTNDINNADLRRAEVLVILEEILRLGTRKNQRRTHQVEDNQHVA